MKVRIFILLFVSGALVHCAPVASQPQEVRVVVVHEYPDARSENADRDDALRPSGPRETPSHAEPAVPEDPVVEEADRPSQDPWTDCAVRRYRTGWVVAECGDSTLRIQAGWSARGGDYLVRQQLIDHINRPDRDASRSSDNTWERKERLELAGRALTGHLLTTRIADEPVPFGGSEATRESPIRSRSLHARVSTPGSGQVGLTCTTSGALFDKATCVRRMSEVIQNGIPGGAVSTRARVTLAGVEIALDSTCRAPAPTQIYCRNQKWEQTSIEWYEGPREQVMRDKARIIGHLMKMDGGDPSLRNDHHQIPCTIAGAEATCESTVFYGVMSTPHMVSYFVTRHDADRSLLVECRLGDKNDNLRRCGEFVPKELHARR